MKHVDKNVVKQGVLDLTRTGVYPGGIEQLQSDVRALIEQGDHEEIMALLDSMGANQGASRQPMVIADHYRPGHDPYRLRWPLGLELPLPFDELDGPTQFAVLFGEWSRRDLDATNALLNAGAADSAAIYEECLARAQQIDVPELEARSHEGLARVAQKRGDRAAERRHLQAAVEARSRTT